MTWKASRIKLYKWSILKPLWPGTSCTSIQVVKTLDDAFQFFKKDATLDTVSHAMSMKGPFARGKSPLEHNIIKHHAFLYVGPHNIIMYYCDLVHI